MTPLISVAETHARLADLFGPLASETVALSEAGGRVLAGDVVAARDQPPFPASAMDGYAVRTADLEGDPTLRVVGISSAGARFTAALGPGETVRIFTGAPVPPEADRVLIQEDVDRHGDLVRPRPTPDAATHIRPAGGDFRAGARLAAPRCLTPADIALAAAMNAPTLKVFRRPLVALIATGDELVSPGETPGPDQIVASNIYGVKALLEGRGAEARILPIARDDVAALRAVIALAEGADLIVTIGGASVGDHDLVRSTASAAGLELDFYRIAMRPGKPMMAGRLGATPMIGLPGNPVSAMVCGRLFLVPAVEAMLGLGYAPPARASGRLAVDVGPNGGREHYMRATVESRDTGWTCAPLPRQDSSLLSVLSAADGLLIRPPGDPARPAGEPAEFIWL